MDEHKTVDDVNIGSDYETDEEFVEEHETVDDVNIGSDFED